ncbi:Glycosyltransferase involved in cell wall bisynthesis [Alteromonadaceae bacterium Bs31]|nr:Glycosyltransferase involved in cell wall bisynthesis [Alteromonadaceae bacterium Bs31]
MQTRLKILMCAYAVDNRDVGEAHLSYHWIDNITKIADVTLITMGSRLNERCGFEDHPHVRVILAKPRLRFVWTGAFDRIIKPDYLEYFYRARKIAKKLVKEEQFDALHHIAPHSPRYPSPLHSLGKNILVGPIHGGLHLPEQYSGKQKGGGLRRIAKSIDHFRNHYDPIMRKHFGSAAKLLISAPYVKENLPAALADKCEVLPPQPPEVLENPPQKPPSEKIRLIFIGRLIEAKGIHLALQALAKTESKTQFIFDIYGTGDLETELKEFCEHNSLQSIVNFRGFTPHDKVLEALHLSDVLFFPSLKEAWGLAVSEAMAAGLCVLCVDRGGPGYMIDEKCGYKVPTGSAEEIVNALTEKLGYIAANHAEAKEKGIAASLKIQQKFTWEAIIKQLKDLYSAASI